MSSRSIEPAFAVTGLFIRSVLAALAALVFAGTASSQPSGVASLAAQPETVAQSAWTRVLQRFVNERGEVDFESLAQDRMDLEAFVRHVAETRLDSLPDGAPRLAHMINAYNALSMLNVVQSGIPATHAGFNKIWFFVFTRFDVGGRRMSLRSFENDLIRPYARSRRDPRIHFALNCSARSCPALPRTPFTAAALDTQLDRATRDFFARVENYRVDMPSRTVWLSELLDFYPEDFVPDAAESLLAYANRYAPHPAPLTFRVRFTPYDWSIANSRRER